MELRDFAERILFAATLEEKLQSPDALTDERPGPPLVAPVAPARPADLRFKPHSGGKADFPGLRRLAQPRERGRLLHFFANHELLATELMALVLLRFPDAPAAFRQGVARTLRDEQEHTRLYLERMKECGIAFGELPVSGYFWRCVSAMEHPIDYVSSLCLTFEQANLDFARHFARGFAAVGDDRTARLLEKIYRDEIGHVAYGLKWFRRWKDPGASDWDAFCRQLKFPLSPQRAKGTTLNVEGRRAAGIDAAFIAELNVYSQSKGRTPGVFVFNPFAEAYIAQGKAFTPTESQAQLARDLGNLPQFLCRQDDIVLVDHRPPVEFLSGLKQAGFALPEFVERSADLSTLHSTATEDGQIGALKHRKLGRLRPWAWGPDSVELFAPLFGNLTSEPRTAEQGFNPAVAQLYSKAWSAALLREFLTRSSRRQEALTSKSEFNQSLLASAATNNEEWLCTPDEVGVAVEALDDALATIAAIRGRGHHRVVVKQAFGLAGSNAIRLFEPKLLDTQRRWIEKAVEQRRQLVIEPWLERARDFSVQLEMTAGGLKLRGYTGLLNDAKGQFQGNQAAPHFARRLPADVTGLFAGPPDIIPRLHALYAEIFSLLETELRRAEYLGPVGIDAFVYRTAEGHCRLKPIVEINPRYTMGRVTVELMNHVTPGSHGLFRIVNRSMARGEGFDEFTGYARSLTGRFPLRLEGEPVPKIREGVLCLNDPAQAQAYLAVFQGTPPGRGRNDF